MAMDYREPRFVNKNKPRRRPFGLYALALAASVMVVYGLGVASGWFACLYKISKAPPAQQTSVLAAVPASQGTGTPGPLPAAPLNKGGAIPLTFYETLPKGGTGVIGSGINPKRLEQQPTAASVQPAPVKPPAVTQQSGQSIKPPASQPTVQVKTPPPQTAVVPTPPPSPPSRVPVSERPAAQRPLEPDRRYTVQVASIKERVDADALRDKLAAKGFNPSIVEVSIPGKGLVYRVRAGRHLKQQEAQNLADRLGSGSIVTPE